MNKIIEIEKQINELEKKLSLTSKNRLKNKLKLKINKLKYNQESLIMLELEQINNNYIELTNKNFDLLASKEFPLKVTKDGGSPIYYYEKELEGVISANGYLYFRTKKLNNYYHFMSSYLHPKTYSGVINYFGESIVKSKKIAFQLIGGRVPISFIGSIDNFGNIDFEMNKSFFETSGHTFVNSIIGDPFKKDEKKRREFLENKSKMKKLILEFKNGV